MGVLLSEAALGCTYSHPSVADTYDIVQQYREAMRFGPEASSTRVARSLDVPRGRVRSWLDGGKPDAVRAIETACELGLLDNEWTSKIRALATLCIGTFACGSIQQAHFRPTWTPSTAIGRSQLETALETVGVGCRIERDSRSTELWPAAHSSLLGRTLAATGAPVGEKTPTTVTGLPEWLPTAPIAVRSRVVELLVLERAIDYEDKATKRIQTARPSSYFRDVADLIESVTNEPVRYSATGVTISASAVRALGIS